MKKDNAIWQVCNLELSKRLKELGVEQDSYFDWVIYPNNKPTELYHRTDKNINLNKYGYKLISAFTVAELGEMLPDYNEKLGNLEISKSYTDHVTMIKNEKVWWNISYWTWKNAFTSKHKDLYLEQNSKGLQQAETEADARAKMLIWLIENKYVEVK